MGSKSDALDKLVVFLAKRDGIDKLVKTFQYIFKLAHWRLLEKHPDLAKRAKLFEDSCGLSRKAFRTGRFLTGFNSLRHNLHPDWKVTLLTMFGSGGEMVYFFFDHFTWMSRVGLLDAKLAARFAFISAYGESVLYISFMTLDVLGIVQDARWERDLLHQLRLIQGCAKEPEQSEPASLKGGELVLFNARDNLAPAADASQQIKDIEAAIRAIRMQKLTRYLSISAQLADLLIALSLVEPRPLWCHPLCLGISGLVSAWSGWYRLWPS